MGRWGAMPNEWAQEARVYHAAQVGDADYLAEVLGCTLEGEAGTMQCGETFLWIGPSGATRLALANIANVQVEGYAKEARAYTATVGTLGGGRVDRAVVYNGQCYGDVGECIGLWAETVEFSNGFQFRAVAGGLELIGPDGTLRDKW